MSAIHLFPVYLILYTRGCKQCEGEGKASYTVVSMRGCKQCKGEGVALSSSSKQQDFEELILVC